MAVLQLIDKTEHVEPENGSKDSSSSMPRLLGLEEAGRYLGVSYWQVRDWVLSGLIQQVKLPCSFVQVRKAGKVYRCPAPAGSTIKRILIDRCDLDALVQRSKEHGLR